MVAGVGLAAEVHEFARYQVIIERAPFGSVSGRDEARGPDFAQRYQFVGQVSTKDNQLLVIVHDKTTNRSYFRAPGENIEDVKVVRLERGSPPRLVIQKGVEVATLVLQSRPSISGPASSAPGAAPVPMTPEAGTTPGRRIPFRRGQ
jgi:hypothetical protein